MSFGAKVLLSALIAAVAVALLFVSSASSPSWWRGGASDPARQALFRGDGTPRRYTKPAFVVLCAASIAVLWLVVP